MKKNSFLEHVAHVARGHYDANQVGKKVKIVRCGRAQFYTELAAHYYLIVGEPYCDFLADLSHEESLLRKSGFYLRHCEFHIAYTEQNDAVGFLAGEMLNEETFHLRWVGVVSEQQRQGISSILVKQLLDFLRDVGYEKVNALHHHLNSPSIKAVLSLGFFLCGIEQNERFGVLVQSLYCLNPERRIQHELRFGAIPNGSERSAAGFAEGKARLRPHDGEGLSAAIDSGLIPYLFSVEHDGTWVEFAPNYLEKAGGW